MKRINIRLDDEWEKNVAIIKDNLRISSDTEALRMVCSWAKDNLFVVPKDVQTTPNNRQVVPNAVQDKVNVPVNAGTKSLAKKPVESSDEEVDWRTTANRGIEIAENKNSQSEKTNPNPSAKTETELDPNDWRVAANRGI